MSRAHLHGVFWVDGDTLGEMSINTVNDYDRVLYPNTPFRQTHPERLASLAILFGMDPAPVRSCRVLEVGGGDGANLIPMAYECPGAQFLGIDASAAATRAGNQEIEALGLTNIRLQHMDILDAGPEIGQFDYVIAHGFYSWVPEPAREKLMELAQSVLAPQGVAYISYNTLPGGHIRYMFRDMMQFHVGAQTDFEARIGGARQMVQWFQSCQPKEGKGSLLRSQVESVMERTPQVLFHDELNPFYYSVYFQDFVGHAARFGLQFLCEANYFDTQPNKLPQDVVAEIDRLAKGDRIVREQYFDFMKCRMFRQTLLCRQDIVLPPEPLPDRLALLRASSTAKPVSRKPDLRPGVAEEFRGWQGTGITAAHPLTKAVMFLLSEAWPQSVPVSDLPVAAALLTGEPPDAEGVRRILMSVYSAGVIDLHTQPRYCVAGVSEFPRASDLARSLARRGKRVTTALHSMMEEADELTCAFIDLLDGTRDVAALVRELAPSSRLPEAELTRGIEENLRLMADKGLLIA